MNTHNSQMFERLVLLGLVLLGALIVYACFSTKIQKAFQKTADRVETVDFEQTMARRER